MKTDSKLEKLLSEGKFVVTAELGPPKNADPEVIIKKAEVLKDVCDAINVTDNQTAVVRMASWAGCAILKRMGLEPVLQMVCRDRNRLALQADLLGAYALGIRNVLCLSGDHQKFGNHPQAKGVYDLDSMQLIQMVCAMRDEQKFQCGDEIKKCEPRFFIGAAANPFADPADYRVQRLAKKIAAGADFIQTQPVYNIEKFIRWMEGVRKLELHKKVYILAGVTPLKRVEMAEYMKYKVPGIDIPDAVLQRMKTASDPQAEGINICVETINELRKIEGVAGIHIMAIAWEKTVPEIVEKSGLMN